MFIAADEQGSVSPKDFFISFDVDPFTKAVRLPEKVFLRVVIPTAPHFSPLIGQLYTISGDKQYF